MRVYRLVTTDGQLKLTLRDEAELRPASGQVVVRMRAVSLNYRDLVMRRGQYGSAAEGKVPCSDGAGDVMAIGDGVTRVKVGDRVAGAFMQRWITGRQPGDAFRSALGGELDGVLADQVCFHESGLVKVPESLTMEEASCLPCAAVTAWQALFVRGKLQAGQSVLVLGTGGVSIFAAQLAAAARARVIATSSSPDKIARLHALGFKDTINYKETPDWDKAVKTLTAGHGVDHIIEVGGGGTIEKSIKAVTAGGHIAQIGVLAGREGAMNPFSLVFKNIMMNGIYVGSREHFEQMNVFIEGHKIKPVISDTFGFEQAEKAFEHMEAARHFGKVVIRL